jgi:hypothetical protein
VAGVEEDSTAAVAADFMAAGQRFTGVEVLAAESIPGLSVGARTADFMVATTQGGATTADITAVTAGAAGIGAMDMVMDGAGELALAGRIGAGDMDIPMDMDPTTTRDITRLGLITLTRPTVLRAIPRALRIKATGTAILNRRIPTHGHSLTRTGPQDTGRHRHRETYSARTTEALPRRVGRFSPLTG